MSQRDHPYLASFLAASRRALRLRAWTGTRPDLPKARLPMQPVRPVRAGAKTLAELAALRADGVYAALTPDRCARLGEAVEVRRERGLR